MPVDWASALAMTTRCFSPPLSVAKRRVSNAEVPVAISASRAMLTSSAPSSSNRPRCGYRPIRTISSTVKSNVEWVSCGTTAMRRASSRRESVSIAAPPTAIRPRRGDSVPDIRRSSVVFPEPLGPSSPTMAPLGTSSATQSTTSRPRRS